MDYGDHYEDYLIAHHETIYEGGAAHIATLVTCECGKEWTKFYDNARLDSVDAWDERLDNHFYGKDNEHDEMMERNNEW